MYPPLGVNYFFKRDFLCLLISPFSCISSKAKILVLLFAMAVSTSCSESIDFDGSTDSPQGFESIESALSSNSKNKSQTEYTQLTAAQFAEATRPRWTDPAYAHLKPSASSAELAHLKSRKSPWPELAPESVRVSASEFSDMWRAEVHRLKNQGMDKAAIDASYDDFKANIYTSTPMALGAHDPTHLLKSL